MLRECSSWAPRNGAVQMFFPTSTRCLLEIFKVSKVSGCAAGAYFFQCRMSCEVRKMNEVF